MRVLACEEQMTTFRDFVNRYTLTQEQINALWIHLMMTRLANWKAGLELAMKDHSLKE